MARTDLKIYKSDIISWIDHVTKCTKIQFEPIYNKIMSITFTKVLYQQQEPKPATLRENISKGIAFPREQFNRNRRVNFILLCLGSVFIFQSFVVFSCLFGSFSSIRLLIELFYSQMTLSWQNPRFAYLHYNKSKKFFYFDLLFRKWQKYAFKDF